MDPDPTVSKLGIFMTPSAVVITDVSFPSLSQASFSKIHDY